MANQYRYGRRKENQLKRFLEDKGAIVALSPGSKGAADVVAEFPTKTWAIQVKSTRLGTPSALTPKELKGLIRKAEQIGATPVIAEIEGNKVSFKSAKIERTLKP